MSIIGKVGRCSAKVRTLNILIHVILALGAVTMVYPFLLMVSSSLKSNVDSNRLSLLPKYFYDDTALFQKYLESRYNEESSRLADNYAGRWLSFSEVELTEVPNQAMYRDWQEFIAKHPQGVYDYYVAEHYGRGVYPLNQRRIRKLLREENGNDLAAFNNRYNTGAQNWEQIVVEEKEILGRNYISTGEGYLGRFQSFKKGIEERHRNYINLDGAFVQMELAPACDGNLQLFNKDHGTKYNSWQDISLAQNCPPWGDPLREYWLRFVRTALNIHHISLKEVSAPAFQDMLRQKYADIGMLNSTWHTNYSGFGGVRLPEELPDSGALVEDLTYFVENLAAPEDLRVRNISNEFKEFLAVKYGSPDRLREAWKPGYDSFEKIPLAEAANQGSLAQTDDWQYFATNGGLNWLEVMPTAQPEYLAFLRERYSDSAGVLNLAKVNAALGTDYKVEGDIYPAGGLPGQSRQRIVWEEFVRGGLDPLFLRVEASPEAVKAWRAYLYGKYRDINSLNQAWELVPISFGEIPLPVGQIDLHSFLEYKGEIRKEFLVRNYAMVLDQMFNDARSLRNTAIYTLLSILLAVTVNPLAAYALSRFKPRFSYQVIMLFMLTMAFPAIVMGIPNFLMLKKLNLLNTFWALVLPAEADGYFIFLLKGFFDSLPRELYESASLDGAGEFRLFWQFTLYLSKPILAVIALGAFNAAYRNFLFAFIVCQDQSMWTLMVHIYELMQRASLSVGYAALVIAAIPTLAVFVFFQNVIIKGIVVPMEK
jgi:multiple sugar transport system permease protein